MARLRGVARGGLGGREAGLGGERRDHRLGGAADEADDQLGSLGVGDGEMGGAGDLELEAARLALGEGHERVEDGGALLGRRVAEPAREIDRREGGRVRREERMLRVAEGGRAEQVERSDRLGASAVSHQKSVDLGLFHEATPAKARPVRESPSRLNGPSPTSTVS